MDSKLVGTSSAERTLDARELAAMRPAAAPRPKQPRKAANPALRQVTNGIMCFCGERFGEHQALEFMLHLRAEFGERLAKVEGYLARRREWRREWEAERLRTDPEYRERKRASKRIGNMSPERQKRERARWAEISPEQRERRRIKDRAENMTPERLERKRAKDRPANMTPERRERRQAQRRARREADSEAAATLPES